jgi:hypothetical protein
MNPVEAYIRNLSEIRSSGAAVKEKSYYGALEALFNEVGKMLKPRVRCIIKLKNRGAGLPDGGCSRLTNFQSILRLNPSSLLILNVG